MNKLPATEEELEAWRAEVERGNLAAREGPRPNLSRGVGKLAMETAVKPTIVEPKPT